MLNSPAKTRLHIHCIEEISADQDMDLAELFSEMREATGQSVGELARKLQTAPDAIEALECGRVADLPPWPETQRVVTAYAGLLDLDPDPMLRRIMLHLPPDHPRRPRTQQAPVSSYDNLQSNINAAINRVPDYLEPREAESLPLRSGASGEPKRSGVSERQPAPSRSAPSQSAPSQSAESRSATSQSVRPKPAASRPAPSRPALATAEAAPAPGRQANPRPPTHPARGQAGAPKPTTAAKAASAGRSAPGYDEFRAYAPEQPQAAAGKPKTIQVERKRKGGLFVLFIQLLLLFILLASGYAIWLAMNDPQGFEQLQKTVLQGYQSLSERISAYIASLRAASPD